MGDSLDVVLAQSRAYGFLGPGPVESQRAHAAAFTEAIDGVPRRALDLGSGGGVPGLVLAVLLPQMSWVLLDSMRKRTSFLQQAVLDLGLEDRVAVVTGRAEDVATTRRSEFDLIVARSFGPPAVTAECAAPFLRPDGQVVVSEPPDSDGDRWPAAGLSALGLRLEATVAGPPSFVRLRRVEPCPPQFPRRTGMAAKRPLFHVER